MFQVALQITPNLPISLVCLSSGEVAFTKTANFKTILDGDVVWNKDGFSVGEESYEYNCPINYKEDPLLMKWLQDQKLEMPNFQEMYGG